MNPHDLSLQAWGPLASWYQGSSRQIQVGGMISENDIIGEKPLPVR